MTEVSMRLRKDLILDAYHALQEEQQYQKEVWSARELAFKEKVKELEGKVQEANKAGISKLADAQKQHDAIVDALQKEHDTDLLQKEQIIKDMEARCKAADNVMSEYTRLEGTLEKSYDDLAAFVNEAIGRKKKMQQTINGYRILVVGLVMIVLANVVVPWIQGF